MRNKNFLIALVILLVFFAGWWALKKRTTWGRGGVETAQTFGALGSSGTLGTAETATSTTSVTTPTSQTTPTTPPSPLPLHASTPPPPQTSPTPPTPSPSPRQEPVTFVVPPGQEGMARHLIPKGITLSDMRFDEPVVAPGTTFGFDVNGSGFDENFYRMITIDADALDVQIKNLQLVTANQIHGQITVGEAALTAYVKPLVYLRGKAVFRAPEGFGAVRRGEVLDIELTSIDESGQWGQFRVITNLDTALFNRIKITPTTPKLEVGNFKPKFPFYIDGVIQIAETLSTGQYGLMISMGPRQIFKKSPLVDVVRPNVGRTGSIEDVKAVAPVYRPGDTALFIIRGSGFAFKDAGTLSAHVMEFDAEASTVTFMSQGRLQAMLRIPPTASTGVYGLRVESHGKKLFEKKTVFALVPPNWLGGLKLGTELRVQGQSMLVLTGRDISAEFVKTLRLEVDEPELKISNIRLQDVSTIVADVQAGPHIRPGDYLVHVFAGDREIKLPGGNLIKVLP